MTTPVLMMVAASIIAGVLVVSRMRVSMHVHVPVVTVGMHMMAVFDAARPVVVPIGAELHGPKDCNPQNHGS